MKRKRRTHSPQFKAKAALAACQGGLTMAELVKKYDVHANHVTDWKRQLLDGTADVFGKGAQKSEAADETIEQLHAKIGRLTIENDFSYGSFCQSVQAYISQLIAISKSNESARETG